ncbi:MAG: hypothetical protein ACLFPS_01000 [Clostridia bacterium]
MSDVLNQKERYDQLIDQLTELEIKYSDLIENEHEESLDSRLSILLKDIEAVKKELLELDGIRQKYQNMLDEKEKQLRESGESKEYLIGYDKVESELNEEIESLQEILQKHTEIILNFEKVLKNKVPNNINEDLKMHQQLINALTQYNIEIEKNLEYSDEEVKNWKTLQSLYDTKDMIDSSINSLIEKKIELKNIKDVYIEDKVKE